MVTHLASASLIVVPLLCDKKSLSKGYNEHLY